MDPVDKNEFEAMRADLHQHLERYEQQLLLDASRWERVIQAQEANTDAINTLVRSTAGLVSAWEAGAGMIKLMQLLGNVGKWTASIGLLFYALSVAQELLP